MANFIAWNIVWVLVCCYLYVSQFEFAAGVVFGFGTKAYAYALCVIFKAKKERKNGC